MVKSKTFRTLIVVLGFAVSVGRAFSQEQEIEEFLVGHSWFISSLDLVDASESLVRITELSAGEREGQTMLKYRALRITAYTIYWIDSSKMYPIDPDYDVLEYVFDQLSGVLQQVNARTGFRYAPMERLQNLESNGLDGIWVAVRTGVPLEEYRSIEQPEEWDIVLEIPDRFPDIWPYGTHLMRWVSDTRLESDGIFGDDKFYIEILPNESGRGPRYRLELISPLSEDERPQGVVYEDLVLSPWDVSE